VLSGSLVCSFNTSVSGVSGLTQLPLIVTGYAQQSTTAGGRPRSRTAIVAAYADGRIRQFEVSFESVPETSCYLSVRSVHNGHRVHFVCVCVYPQIFAAGDTEQMLHRETGGMDLSRELRFVTGNFACSCNP
jgi:hypothetical protein